MQVSYIHTGMEDKRPLTVYRVVKESKTTTAMPIAQALTETDAKKLVNYLTLMDPQTSN